MNRTTISLVICAGGLWLALGGKLPASLPFGPAPVVVPVDPIATPSPELQAAMRPVIEALAGHRDDARQIGEWASAVRDVTKRDKEIIASTGQWREGYRRAGLLLFQGTGIYGAYPKVSEAVEAMLADQIGLPDVALDGDKRAKIDDCMAAFVWATGQVK